MNKTNATGSTSAGSSVDIQLDDEDDFVERERIKRIRNLVDVSVLYL